MNQSATFAYDAASRMTSTTDRDGRRRDFSYDNDNRKTGETHPNAPPPMSMALAAAVDPDNASKKPQTKTGRVDVDPNAKQENDAPGFKSIKEVTDELEKNDEAKRLVDKFKKEGGIIVSDPNAFSGGNWSLSRNRVGLNPYKTGDKNPAASVLPFDLLRWKHKADKIKLEDKARAGTITKREYGIEAAELTYQYIEEHRKLAQAGIKAGNWKQSFDRFGADKYSSFEKYLQFAKQTGHYNRSANQYDDLRRQR